MSIFARARAGLIGLALALYATYPVVADPLEFEKRFADAVITDIDGDGARDAVVQPRTTGQRVEVYTRIAGSEDARLTQTLSSDAFGLSWVLGDSEGHSGDFNGDGRGDILLLGRSRDSQGAVVLADPLGQLSTLGQAFDSRHLGLAWNADESRPVIGDFDGDGRDDVLLQPADANGELNTVLAEPDGSFGVGVQAWRDGFLSRTWNAGAVALHTGDFNGDGRDDLLLAVTDRDLLKGKDRERAFALLLAGEGGRFEAIARTWGRKAFGPEWDPADHELLVDDFDRDGRADVWMRARRAGIAGAVLYAGQGGAFAGRAMPVAPGATPAAGRAIQPTPVPPSALKPAGRRGDEPRMQTVQIPPGKEHLYTAGARSPLTSYTPGATPSSFNVDAVGGARYTIPLVTPPGIAGIQPSLAISYSSNAGNGLAGMGFGVSGFSVITRCEKTVPQDGVAGPVTLTANDKYCLDGQRLRYESGPAYGGQGTKYRTEIESFKRITSYTSGGQGAAVTGGPQYFTVETGDGLIYEYGARDDSRIEVAPLTVVRVWALSRVRDRFGNYMDYDYTEDGPNREYRPSAIRWTGNGAQAPIYRADFTYENRPAADYVATFVSGGLERNTKRLTKIETKHNGNLIRDYRLTYDATNTSATKRSRVMSVQECAGGTCLPPHTMTWQNGEAGWDSPADSSAGTFTATERDNAIPMDVNGDGRDDLVFPRGTTWHVSLASAADGKFQAPVNTTRTFYGTYYQFALVIDLNADGKKDLLVPGQTYWQVLMGSDASPYFTSAIPVGIASDTNTRGKANVADVNADGYEDFVYATGTTIYQRLFDPNTGAFSAATTLYTLPGNASNPFGTIGTRYRSIYRIVNLDNDGRADLLVRAQYMDCEESGCVQVVEWRGISTATGNEDFWTDTASSTPLPLDANGDGRTDFAYLENGAWTLAVGGEPYGTGIAGSAADSVLAVDFDGDGLTDLLTNQSGSTWKVMRSNGLSLQAPVDTGIAYSTDTLRVADTNGDGLSDFTTYQTTGTAGWKHVFHKGKDMPPDMAVAFKDSLENEWNPRFDPITNPTVYSPTTWVAMFPTQKYLGPMYVVSSTWSPDGIGSQFSTFYNYEDARIDRQGRGFLGFRTVAANDQRVGSLYRKTSFNNFAWPMAGTVEESLIKQSPTGPNVFRAYNTYLNTVVGSGYDVRSVVTLSSRRNERHEVGGTLNGNLIASRLTNYTYDAFGNVDLVTEGIGAGSSTTEFITTVNPAFTNYTSGTEWCLGRQTAITITRQIGAGTPESRSATATHSGSTCRQTTATLPNDSVYTSPNIQITQSFTYDAYGNVATVTATDAAASSRVTTISHAGTSGYFPTSVTNPAGQTVSATWNFGAGALATNTDVNSLTSSLVYDAYGRSQSVTTPDGVQVRGTFDWVTASCQSNGLCIRQTVERLAGAPAVAGGTTLQYFDIAGRLARTDRLLLGGQFSISQRTFDQFGRVAAEQIPHFASDTIYGVTRTFDALGRTLTETRPASASQPAGATSNFAYVGLTTRTTDPLSKVTERTLNARGDVTAMKDASNGITTYQYNPFRELIATTDHLGNKVTMAYDSRGNKRAMSDPDTGQWSYAFNAFGELVSQTDAKAQSVMMTYDNLGRPLSRSEPEGVTNWFYDTAAGAGVGKIRKVTGPGGYEKTWTYDGVGRNSATSETIGGIQYDLSLSFDAFGRPLTITYPSSTGAAPFAVTYEYDASGALTKAKNAATPSTVYWQNNAMNALGAVTQETLGGQVVSNVGIDPSTGRVASIQSGVGSGSALQNLTFTWNSAGNLAQRQDLNRGLTETFTYDDLYRLTGAAVNGLTTTAVSYDAIGNILTKDATTYSYPTSGPTSVRPHAVSGTTGFISGSFAYDGNGNMTTKPGGSLSWTSFNMPATVSKGAESSSFEYSPERTRTKQTATYSGIVETTVYVAGLMEKTTKSTGQVEYRHFIRAGGRTVAIHSRIVGGASSTRLVLRDHLGSVNALTDESGVLLASMSFDPFGARRDSATWVGSVDWGSASATISGFRNLTSRGFTGHEMLDSVGLVHMNGRVYDPHLARFVSADPKVTYPLNSQSFNRYSYVLNSPMMFTDPSGFDPDWGLFLEGGIGAVAGTWTTYAALTVLAAGTAPAWILVGSITVTAVGGLMVADSLATMIAGVAGANYPGVVHSMLTAAVGENGATIVELAMGVKTMIKYGSNPDALHNVWAMAHLVVQAANDWGDIIEGPRSSGPRYTGPAPTGPGTTPGPVGPGPAPGPGTPGPGTPGPGTPGPGGPAPGGGGGSEGGSGPSGSTGSPIGSSVTIGGPIGNGSPVSSGGGGGDIAEDPIIVNCTLTTCTVEPTPNPEAPVYPPPGVPTPIPPEEDDDEIDTDGT